MSLSARAVDFSPASHVQSEDVHGSYFPDAVIEPFFRLGKEMMLSCFTRYRIIDSGPRILSPLNRHRLSIDQTPPMLLETSFSLIQMALAGFDRDLGEKTGVICNDMSYWRLTPVAPGEASGRCQPKNYPDETCLTSVIFYEYESTIYDPIIMAHEIGHVLADMHGHVPVYSTHRHMLEIQAYFLQHVVYDYLQTHSDTSLSSAARLYFISETATSLVTLPLGMAGLAVDRFRHDHADPQIHVASQIYGDTVAKWLGEKWAAYRPANETRHHIFYKKLIGDEDIDRLHKHPMACLVALGLFRIVRDCPEKKTLLIDAIFGFTRPHTIIEVLDVAGITTPNAYDALVMDVLSAVALPLLTFQA